VKSQTESLPEIERKVDIVIREVGSLRKDVTMFKESGHDIEKEQE